MENIGDIIDAAVVIIQKLADGIIANLPKLVKAAVDIIFKLVDALIANVDMLIQAAVDIIVTLSKSLLSKDNISRLIKAAIDLILALANALTNPDTLMSLVNAAFDIVKAIVDALVENAPELLLAAVELITTLCSNLLTLENLEKMWDAGKDLIQKLWDGIKALFSDLLDWFAGIGTEIGYKFEEVIEAAKQWGKDLIEGFINGCKEAWNKWKGFWEDIGEGIYDFLHHSTPEKGPLKDDDKWGGDLMDNFIGGAEAKEKELARTFAGIAQTAADALEVDAHGVSFEGAIKAAQDAQRGIDAAGKIIDVRFDMNAIAAAIEQIEKTPIVLEATLDTDSINPEILTGTVSREASMLNSATPADYGQATNVSFAGAEIKIVAEGADRNGADIADEIADRLAFMDNLANLKAGKVAL